jgi:ribosomal protein S18 acetylase RimI-like enzyme
MREIVDHGELVRACRGDTRCVWVARGLRGGSRAWANDGAVAAFGSVSSRDRLAVWGEPEAAVELVRAVLTETGPDYRCMGEPGLVRAVADAIPGMALHKDFGWMQRTGAPLDAGTGATTWLDVTHEAEIAAVLDAGFPTSYARPGDPDVDRWAGVRDPATGRLVAVAALAWSAPTVAMLSGVAVDPAARGRGLGRQVCAFAVRAALVGHGTAVLMVDEDNAAAIRLYRALGMDWQRVSVAVDAVRQSRSPARRGPVARPVSPPSSGR